jgi:hypothetical protein
VEISLTVSSGDLIAEGMTEFHQKVDREIKKRVEAGIPIEDMMLTSNPGVDLLLGHHELHLWDMRIVQVIATFKLRIEIGEE